MVIIGAIGKNLKIWLHVCVRTPVYLCTNRKLEATRRTQLVKYVQARLGYDLDYGLYPIFRC